MKHIHNFSIDGRRVDSDEMLRSIVTNWLESPRCINIYPQQPGAQAIMPFTESSRQGGLGKTVLLKKISSEIAAVTQRSESAPLIDFSGGQFNTKAYILREVVDRLLAFCPNFRLLVSPHLAFDQFKKKILNRPKNGKDRDYDPSVVAERLFSEFSAGLRGQIDGFALCFDGYDGQHVGQIDTALRVWLSEDLFPWLVREVGVTVVVAGRDRLENKHLEEKEIVRIEVRPFDVALLKEFVRNAIPATLTPRPEPEDLFSDKDWAEIHKYTEGKPIFIDLFCTLLIRDCLREKPGLEFAEFLKRTGITDALVSESLKNRYFKEFLLRRIYYKDNDETDPGKTLQIRKALVIFCVAKYGLDYKDYVAIADDGSTEAEIKEFFETTFFEIPDVDKYNEDRSGLSYVKSRGSIRFLHDEVYELIQEYALNKDDRNHSFRNKRLRAIITYYESRFINNELYYQGRFTGTEFYRRLLEYTAYQFEQRGREYEKEAINRFLYDFSRLLDHYPDMCRHLLDRAMRYYALKQQPSDHEKSLSDTLVFSNDFDQLCKIPIRELVFLLTERPEDWRSLVDTRTDKINKYAEEFRHVSADRANGIRARIAAILGERYIWDSKSTKALKELYDAKRGLSRTHDWHGINWVQHLLGFYYQRDANFEVARAYHHASLQSSLKSCWELGEKILRQKGDGAQNREKYQFLLLIKILLRAGSNAAVNRSYSGLYVEGIQKLQSIKGLARWLGTREDLRVEINMRQLEANLNIYKGIKKLSRKSYLINDPLLPRRLMRLRLTRATNRAGNENRAYYYRRDDFFSQGSISSESSAKLKRALQALAAEFKPNPRPLNIEEHKKQRPDLYAAWGETPNPPTASREIADIYMQVGQMVLAYQLFEKDESFRIAQQAFENCQIVAEETGFEYLVYEAQLSISRMNYLYGREEEARQILTKIEQSSIKSKTEKGYEPYRNLLARFHLSWGDLHLESDPVLALQYYVKMLSQARRFNQSFYNEAIEIFCDRAKYLLRKKGRPRQEIEAVFERRRQEERDPHLKNFLPVFLEAATLVERPDEVRLKDLREHITWLMEQGEFVKAGCINDCIIDVWPRDNRTDEELAMRLFQKFYIHQWADRHEKAGEVLEEICEYTEYRVLGGRTQVRVVDLKNPFALVYAVCYPTWLYRDEKIWTIQKFLYDELGAGFSKTDADHSIEDLFKKAIDALIRKVDGAVHGKSASNAMRRLLTAAIFRLGELLVLKGKFAKYSKADWEAQLASWAEKHGLKSSRENGIDLEENAGIYLLNLAYEYGAKVAKDDYRALESLQSLATARYFAPDPQGRVHARSAVLRLHDRLREKIAADPGQYGRYPLLVARMEMLEGNAYFEELLALMDQAGNKLDYTPHFELVQKITWSYLSALNALAASSRTTDAPPLPMQFRPYETFHFNNMLLELNRRILLIKDRQVLRQLNYEIDTAWTLFDNLVAKDNIRASIEQEILLHEAALLAHDVLQPGTIAGPSSQPETGTSDPEPSKLGLPGGQSTEPIGSPADPEAPNPH